MNNSRNYNETKAETGFVPGIPIPIPAYNSSSGKPVLGEFLSFIAYKKEATRHCKTAARTYCGAYYNHWAPIFDLCFPCDIDYEYIVELKTASEDFAYIFEKANPNYPNITSITSKPFGSMNLAKSQGMWSPKEIKQKLMAKIPRKLIVDAMKSYTDDYGAFGYDFDLSISEYLPPAS